MMGAVRFAVKRKLALGVLSGACGIATLLAIGCSSTGHALPFRTEGAAPAEQNIGERIFVDTRWAQYFATHMTDVNSPLAVGDPVVSQTQTINGPLPGPFAGQSINCRSCHFVVEFQGVKGAGNRTYADFTTRSPIPRAMNGFTLTPRNSMQMVGSLQPHSGPQFLHFDGEFADPADLVKKQSPDAILAGGRRNIRRPSRTSRMWFATTTGRTIQPMSLDADSLTRQFSWGPIQRFRRIARCRSNICSTSVARPTSRLSMTFRRSWRNTRLDCGLSRTKWGGTSRRHTMCFCARTTCRRNRRRARPISSTGSDCLACSMDWEVRLGSRRLTAVFNIMRSRLRSARPNWQG